MGYTESSDLIWFDWLHLSALAQQSAVSSFEACFISKRPRVPCFPSLGRNSFAVHRTLFPTSPPECRRPVDTRTTEGRREGRVWIVVALATVFAHPNSHGFIPDATDASGSMVTIRTSSALVRGDAQQLRHITRYIWHNRSFIYNCSRSVCVVICRGFAHPHVETRDA